MDDVTETVFRPGQRVRATERFRRAFPGSPATGVVVRVIRRGFYRGHPVVLRDGRKTPVTYGPTFWEPDPAEPDLVTRVLDYLFTSGTGETAGRLVLTSADGKDLGGFVRPAPEQYLRGVLTEPPA